MVVKLYSFFASQPVRSVFLFLKVNGIEFEEQVIDLIKDGQHNPEYEKINQLKSVPMIDHDGFRLTESVAILMYLAEKFDTPDHWYPKDIQQRAKVDEYMAFHHLNTRKNFTQVFLDEFLIPLRTKAFPPEADWKEHVKNMKSTVDTIENVFLQDKKFLCGEEISIADLLAVHELLQLGLTSSDPFPKHPKLVAWRDRIREAVNPHHDEIMARVEALKQIPIPTRPVS